MRDFQFSVWEYHADWFLFLLLAFFITVDGDLHLHCVLKESKYTLRELLKFTAPPVVKMLGESSSGKSIN